LAWAGDYRGPLQVALCAPRADGRRLCAYLSHHTPQSVLLRLFRDRSTPSCFSLRYRCVRSSPVFSATRVMLPFSCARWNSK